MAISFQKEKSMKKRFVLGLMLLCGATSIEAQDEVETTVGTDVVSSYIWRGQDLGSAALQPTLGIGYKGLSLTAWGSYGIADPTDTKEFDLTLAYTIGGLNIGVTDYWQTGIEPNDLYFAYNKQTTAHRLEGNIGYTCRYGSVQAYCMFYGHDTKIDGSQAYSTYIELTVPFRLGGLDWTAKAGFTPMESAGWTVPDYATLSESLHYFYADGPTCVMASVRATKNLKLRGVTLPIFAELHTNPYMQTAHIMGGIGVKVTK